MLAAFSYLPSHMKVTNSRGDSMFRRLSSDNSDAFFHNFRLRSLFVFHHLLSPFENGILDGVATSETLRTLFLHEVNASTKRFVLPAQLQKIVAPICNYYIVEFLSHADESVKEVMLPYMDMWAVAGIYLALVSCRVQEEKQFDDWLANWFIYVSNIQHNFKLRTEIKDCYFNPISSKSSKYRL